MSDCLFVQPAGPPFCLQCSPLKVHVFHLETRPSSPPGPPISVIPVELLSSEEHQTKFLLNYTFCFKILWKIFMTVSISIIDYIKKCVRVT